MHIPHELQDEFPDETRLIARLTKTNYLFRRLASRYDEINLQIIASSWKMSQPRTRSSKGSRKSALS